MTRADLLLVNDIRNILANGTKDENPRPKYEDGTPAYTYFVNHVVRTYNLQTEFPICTLRPIAWKSAIREIFTIYQKPTNVISEMEDMGVRWWNDWNIGDGTIGHRYGYTVKKYDLINNLINDIKTNPYGRRKIISLWQENDLRETDGLAPCAFLTIWNVRGEYLDMCLIQRSGDMITERVNYCSFATKQQILDNDFYIINPTGYYELKLKTKGMDVHLVTIMVNVPFSELRKRAKKRGDFSTWEANYKKESEEFTIFEKSNLIDYFVLNDGNIEESIKKMENIIKKDKSKRGVTTDEN